jgi:hypothetical protein
MWLRDSLPRDLDGARIMVYGHDSQLSETSSVQNISDIATQLRSGLRGIRSFERVCFALEPHRCLLELIIWIGNLSRFLSIVGATVIAHSIVEFLDEGILRLLTLLGRFSPPRERAESASSVVLACRTYIVCRFCSLNTISSLVFAASTPTEPVQKFHSYSSDTTLEASLLRKYEGLAIFYIS